MSASAIDIVQMDPVPGFDRRLGSADLFAVLDNRLINSKTHEGDLVTRCDRATGVETAHPRIGAHLHRLSPFDIGEKYRAVVAGVDF